MNSWRENWPQWISIVNLFAAARFWLHSNWIDTRPTLSRVCTTHLIVLCLIHFETVGMAFVGSFIRFSRISTECLTISYHLSSNFFHRLVLKSQCSTHVFWWISISKIRHPWSDEQLDKICRPTDLGFQASLVMVEIWQSCELKASINSQSFPDREILQSSRSPHSKPTARI